MIVRLLYQVTCATVVFSAFSIQVSTALAIEWFSALSSAMAGRPNGRLVLGRNPFSPFTLYIPSGRTNDFHVVNWSSIILIF
jgi:hypothetical protein